MKSFAPRLEVLPAAQRALWPELSAVPKGFVLYGGTALALRLGHRTSMDFDLFSSDPLDRRALEKLPAALLRAGVSLSDMLRAAGALFGAAFNPLIAKKTLGWFEGADLSALDTPTRDLLLRASLQDDDLPPMPLAAARLD